MPSPPVVTHSPTHRPIGCLWLREQNVLHGNWVNKNQTRPHLGCWRPHRSQVWRSLPLDAWPGKSSLQRLVQAHFPTCWNPLETWSPILSPPFHIFWAFKDIWELQETWCHYRHSLRVRKWLFLHCSSGLMLAQGPHLPSASSSIHLKLGVSSLRGEARASHQSLFSSSLPISSTKVSLPPSPSCWKLPLYP